MMTNETTESTIDMLRARSSFYRVLESFYYKKLTEDQIDSMSATDYSAFGEVSPIIKEGFDDIRHYLARNRWGARERLAVDFTAAWVGTSTYEGRYAEPFESLFRGEESRLAGEPAAEVYRALKRASLKVDEYIHLPSDHLSFEMEYLAIMGLRAADQLEAGDLNLARENLETQRAFLNDHVLSWFDDFKALSEKILKTRLYCGVLKVTKGFIELDDELLADAIDLLGEAA
ncbi:molecular chaperone [Denitrobacterium detoxificans]|jgi:TorA maturation chaperone TorD|uniref:TorD/DmsD family molecular chaperone n=1 Tax=Denitrobacterium detoxificans TaxID=79604 RepID=UPI0026ED8D43|nr:molecular chaperone TorD family protein [Denitrobacterium detoxificans]